MVFSTTNGIIIGSVYIHGSVTSEHSAALCGEGTLAIPMRQLANNCVRLLALPLLILVAGCSVKTAQTAPPIQAVPVTVAKAVQKTIPIDLTAIGSGEAYTTVSIKAQVNATLDQVHFTQGDFVSKGQLLFTLDARPFQAAVDQADASLGARQSTGAARRGAGRALSEASRRRRNPAGAVRPGESYSGSATRLWFARTKPLSSKPSCNSNIARSIHRSTGVPGPWASLPEIS